MSGERERRLAALSRAFRDRLRADREMLRRLSRDGPLPDASRGGALLACVHRLGGSAGTFGAPRISLAAERMEEHLRRRGEAPCAALAELLAELDRELDGAVQDDRDRR